jgi:hypothetical protein
MIRLRGVGVPQKADWEEKRETWYSERGSSMRTTLVVRPYVWENIPGHIVLFVDQLDPAHPQGSSIAHLKQRFGGVQRAMEDPYTHAKYLFDLTPWLHLPEETRLRLRWGFAPEHPIPPSDPRYPKHL